VKITLAIVLLLLGFMAWFLYGAASRLEERMDSLRQNYARMSDDLDTLSLRLNTLLKAYKYHKKQVPIPIPIPKPRP